ncbi:hypothetical protein [Microlunatus sp. GCM10028923]|uniref:hypothetical protein n=1 Tax=Microlunatus sp. GCM10028923 TaxID=3273400 RepID=UPI003617542A
MFLKGTVKLDTPSLSREKVGRVQDLRHGHDQDQDNQGYGRGSDVTRRADQLRDDLYLESRDQRQHNGRSHREQEVQLVISPRVAK